MNAYALFLADEALRLANAHADELRDEAVIERLGASVRPARGIGWIFRPVVSVARTFRDGLEIFEAGTPRLADYPYRS
jgi:hypothetical protein